MEINGNTATCGLLGYPVEHTLSPVIHNTLAELKGDNIRYLPFRVAPEELDEAVKGAYALGVLGLNVTVPHKESVIASLTELDDLAKKIGAVNTLVRSGNGYEGYNTDMPGLYRAMQSDGVRVEGREVLILGAGGVARAVAVMLMDKAGHITILNRTREKAQAIAQEVNGYMGKTVADALPLSEYGALAGKDYLAVQSTNVGMYPHVEDVLIEDNAFYQKIGTAYDLIFNPFQTRFLQLAGQAGAECCNGLKMLLYQGILAYELWNDTHVSEEEAAAVYGRLRGSL